MDAMTQADMRATWAAARHLDDAMWFAPFYHFHTET